jgi:Fatty acid desaturase
MKIYRHEVEFAQRYTRYLHSRELPFQGLTDEQSQAIIVRGRALYRWFKTHQQIHNLISVGVLSLLFLGDFLVLMVLPGLFLGASPTVAGSIALGSLITGVIRGWLLYSMGIYTLHEGAAHKLIFRGSGPVTRLLGTIASNLCRIIGADPVSYTADHHSHHGHFGTEKDAELVNFILPRRYWLTLIPFAMLVNFSDFVVHRPLSYTQSRALSTLVALVYHGTYCWLVTQRFGLSFALPAVALISLHVAFLLDRVRHFSEHNLMPIEARDGARSFGPGLWGLVIGGGPWGQPCHWMHHLIPSIPWYQQIILHHEVAKLLTPQQRKQYLLEPFVGYPRLLWRLWTEPNRFARKEAKVDVAA